MNCKEVVPEIVEAARTRRRLEGAVRAHVAHCADCSARRDAEAELASHFDLMRARASAKRSSATSRDDLMRQFAARHWRLIHPAWGLGLAAAAALLISIATVRGPFGFGSKTRDLPPAIGTWLSSSSSSVEPAPDIAGSQDQGFVPVLYAPPLAEGERLSVMHAELYPAALTTMGVSFDPAEIASNGNATIHADVIVGEDGLPRAVRLLRDQPEIDDLEKY